MTVTISFKPWRVRARLDEPVIHRWMNRVADQAEKNFKSGGQHPPASAPGDYPAQRSGALVASFRKVVRGIESLEVSSNTHYSGYLVTGTRKMAARRMSEGALQDALDTNPTLGKFAKWSR